MTSVESNKKREIRVALGIIVYRKANFTHRKNIVE